MLIAYDVNQSFAGTMVVGPIRSHATYWWQPPLNYYRLMIKFIKHVHIEA